MDDEGIEQKRGQQPPIAELRSSLQATLTEDGILAQLERRDLPAETIEEIGRNPGAMKSRKVAVALAAHPRAPRHLALRLIRKFYTFDLMRFSLHPTVAADLKRIAEEQLIARIASVTLGERLALARRGSQAVAAALLLDKEPSLPRAALENPRLTEGAVIKALMRPNAPAAFVELVCHHPKWSLRREIRMTLLRSPHTPLARALEFASPLPPPLLRDILHTSRLPEKIKVYLRNHPKERK
jgi:hypothetical protein